MIQHNLFAVARRIGKHPSAGLLFCLTQRLLPLRVIARRPGLVAFHHPRPVADPHVLIVPTRPVSSITSERIPTHTMASLIWDILQLAWAITPALPASDSWQIVINGGSRQDIGQMHGHLLHANTGTDSGFFPLTNPDTDMAPWTTLLQELHELSTLPGAGSSLEILWDSARSPMVRITRTPLA